MNRLSLIPFLSNLHEVEIAGTWRDAAWGQYKNGDWRSVVPSSNSTNSPEERRSAGVNLELAVLDLRLDFFKTSTGKDKQTHQPTHLGASQELKVRPRWTRAQRHSSFCWFIVHTGFWSCYFMFRSQLIPRSSPNYKYLKRRKTRNRLDSRRNPSPPLRSSSAIISEIEGQLTGELVLIHAKMLLWSWTKGLSTSPPRRAVALLFCTPTERDSKRRSIERKRKKLYV